MEKRKAGGRQNEVEKVNSKIWVLKYNNNEHLGIKLKKCNNHHHINNQRAKINEGGEGIRIF